MRFSRVSSLFVGSLCGSCGSWYLDVLSSLGCYHRLDSTVLCGLRLCVYWPHKRHCSTSLLRLWSTEVSFYFLSALGSPCHNLDQPSRGTASVHRARVSTISITGYELERGEWTLPVIATYLRWVLVERTQTSTTSAGIFLLQLLLESSFRWRSTLSQPVCHLDPD